MKRRTIAISAIVVIGLVGLVTGILLAWPATPAPVVASRPADAPPARLASSAPSAPAKLAVTRIAHSTVLLDFDGEKVLTDPWFSETEEYYQGEPLGLSLGELPRLTAVIVSHEHFDHFDIKAFAAYPDKNMPFFVPRGTGMAESADGGRRGAACIGARGGRTRRDCVGAKISNEGRRRT